MAPPLRMPFRFKRSAREIRADPDLSLTGISREVSLARLGYPQAAPGSRLILFPSSFRVLDSRPYALTTFVG